MKSWLIGFGVIGGWFSGYKFETDAEKVLLSAVFIVVVLDWFTGLSAAYKEGIRITSNRMRQGIYKLITYLAYILLAMVTGNVLEVSGVKVPLIPISQDTVLSGVLASIVITEMLSILENCHRLSGMRIKWLQRILEGLAKEPDAKEEKKTTHKR